MDFWLTRVGPSPRWPLVVIAGENPEDDITAATRTTADAVPPVEGPASEHAPAFLKLPRATAEQRALFDEAFEKIGADEDRWAYTEITRAPGEKRPTITRVDPSKPESERCTLLQVGGKPPSAEDARRWRDAGHDTCDPLGELRDIRNAIDRGDVRVFAMETAAIVFELPLPVSASTSAFPADKFQALFRVNKATRALEDIVVKMREPMRMSGVAKVTDVSMEVHFQTLDPAFPPQPVLLRGGGAVRLLLVKIARDFETTRTDFQRVEPQTSASP